MAPYLIIKAAIQTPITVLTGEASGTRTGLLVVLEIRQCHLSSIFLLLTLDSHVSMVANHKEKPHLMKWIPRFRFSIRTLMIVTMLLAIGLSFVSRRIYKAHRQHQAIAHVVEHDGHVRYQYEDLTNHTEEEPTAPKWIRSIFGENYFEKVGIAGVRKGTDLSIVANLEELKTLYLYSVGDGDISPLVGLKNLEFLQLTYVELVDISALAKLENLERLHISGNEISDLSPLSGHKKLSALDLTNNKLTDISPLAKVPNLYGLSLHNNEELTDISPLEDLKDLHYLQISYTQVTDISSLAGISTLDNLSISGTNVSDITPLANLTNLEILELYQTKVTNLKPLAKLKNIYDLYLSNTNVSDIGPLANLTNLELLLLDETNVSDITPLLGLHNLATLDLNKTDVSKEDIAILEQALPNCSIDSEFIIKPPPSAVPAIANPFGATN